MAKKKSLEILLKEMDSYDWSVVPDWKGSEGYAKMAPEIFQEYLTKVGLKLNGLVLDVCSGPVSFGSIYNNVVGFDLIPSYIKELRKNGIRGIIGDIRDMPFKDKSFDYVVCVGAPMMPYKKMEEEIFLKKCPERKKDDDLYCYLPSTENDLQFFIEKFVEDCIRISKNKTLIVSYPILNCLPKKNKLKIEKISDKMSECYVIYSHSYSVYVNNLWKKIAK